MNGFASLRGKKVGVWGAGVEGKATLRRLEVEGVSPLVVVSEDGSPKTTSLHDGGLATLLACDVVIKSPGISRYCDEARQLREAGVRITIGLDLWMHEVDRERVMCITGTKGKSTTSAIAQALMSGLGHSVLLGGNIGHAPWDPELDAADWYVIETSSYQAADLTLGPATVVLTSLGEDHLPWHGDYRTYVSDKLSLATLPGVVNTIAPAWDAEIRKHHHLLGDQVTWIEDASPAWIDQLGVLGEHNRRNALLARAALKAAQVPGASDDSAIEQAARNYTPLPSRLTLIGEIAGVKFVDDSLSTNALPTIAAIETFKTERLAVILGGEDRGIDYAPLAEAIAHHPGTLFIAAIPDSGERIARSIEERIKGIVVERAPDLAAAVQTCFDWAKPNGVVLLSPAAPSFGAFKDYADRSRAFTAEMEKLRT